jgi:hypothetical protein
MSQHPLDQRFREELEFYFDPTQGTINLSGLVYEPIGLLDALGQEAYDFAYNTWKNETWLPEQYDRVQEWLGENLCKERFDNLCEAIRGDTVIPFVGSGMSAPSGYPLWKDVLIELSKRSDINESRCKELLSAQDYESAFLEISAGMPEAFFNECFQNLFPDRRDNLICGSVRFIPLIFKSDVITTNFDRILEKAYQDNRHSFQETLYGDKLKYFQRFSADGRQCLIKIHGDRSWHEFRALTKQEYDVLYSPEGICTSVLKRLFRDKTLLFMGCSLVNDRPLELFHKLSSETPGEQKHYALLRAPEDKEERLKKEFWLAVRSIFPIWYVGDHDECLETIFTVILDRLGRL